jgi:hypothetical protein
LLEQYAVSLASIISDYRSVLMIIQH